LCEKILAPAPVTLVLEQLVGARGVVERRDEPEQREVERVPGHATTTPSRSGAGA
jgi:hypothetical protein